MIGKQEYMKPITRVHNIFRIRTISNAVYQENEKSKYPNDKEIAKVLAESKLSKFRKEKMKDRIMRRARDHLLTASYMGLISRKGRPFRYFCTESGKMLSKYTFDQECPNDENEESVFIDKLMRMKITNVFDIQSGGQYLDIRSRPCLYILSLLNSVAGLHEHQIALECGTKKSDPVLMGSTEKRLLRSVSAYKEKNKVTIEKFYSDFSISKRNRINMSRNMRPLLDWCESLGLIASSDIEGVRGRWYTLTDRGLKILEIYRKKTPLWFIDLKKHESLKASLLIFCDFLKHIKLDINSKFLDSEIAFGLVRMKVRDILHALTKENNIKFERGFSALHTEIDFTLEYDVPPENKDEIFSILKRLSKLYSKSISDVIKMTEIYSISTLKSMLETEHNKLKIGIVNKFSENTRIIEDPVLERVEKIIPSTGILNQYRSDFEKEVAILLRLLKLNAIKYQGQLADRCHKSYIARFFENNPDMLIKNGIESLVECKSIGEWRYPLTNVKSIPKEFIIYQTYIDEVKSDSITIVYEGNLDGKSKKIISDIMSDAVSVLFVTKNYLINCAYKPALREKLIETMKNPKHKKPEMRIFN
ncbi:MAG: hypothetical protein NTU57_00345 [Candidatus Aenigmarchaeota archaeon]|nr:hypothetical protein [Candidatus Aenigmarchaeota archaeon]